MECTYKLIFMVSTVSVNVINGKNMMVQNLNVYLLLIYKYYYNFSKKV